MQASAPSDSRNTVISIILILLALIASLFGLFGNVYRDSDWAASQLKGQDGMTLIGLPLPEHNRVGQWPYGHLALYRASVSPEGSP